MAPAVKLEKRTKSEDDDSALAKVLRISREEARVKQERGAGSCRVKAEVRVKAEAASRVKSEPPLRGAKLEPGVKAEGRDGPLPPLSAKLEQVRNVKAELLRRAGGQPGSGIAGLLARGLQMRAQAAKSNATARVKVKGEPGKRGKMKLVTVKKERPRNADGKLRKKRRITAKGRASCREAMAREVPLSDDLADVLGADALSRPEAVKRLWAYCRENGMLNPDNRREIHFDTKLEQMLGQPVATMPQLISLLTPHFDYCKQAALKQELKTEQAVKSEIKAEQKSKIEQKKDTLKTKRELSSALNVSAKKEKHDTASGVRMKQEKTGCLDLESGQMENVAQNFACEGLMEDVARAVVEDALVHILPSITSFDAEFATVECRAPPGCFELEAVATPTTSSAAVVVRKCTAEFREDASCGDDGMVAFAEARLDGLIPGITYSIRVRITGSSTDQADASRGGTSEILLPQRVRPASWTPRETEIWCGTQRIPELVKMSKEYAIDGSTLLTLSEEDLRAFGVTAPFLLRRALAGIKALSGGA